MLVVLAILGVLSTVLFSIIGTTRSQADLITATARLRQLGSAFQLYLNDNNGYFPQPRNESTNRWVHYVAPYIGDYHVNFLDNGRANGFEPGGRSIYSDPLLRDPVNPYNPQNTASGTFGYNVELEGTFGNNQAPRIHAIDLPDAPKLPVLGSSEGPTGGGLRMTTSGPSLGALAHGYSGTTDRSGPAPNYGGNAVFLFADWHVEARNVCDPTQWPWNDPLAFSPRIIR